VATPVLVLYGGQSSEHEVSCRSAKFIMKTLNQSDYILGAIGIDRQGSWYPQEPSKLLEMGSEQLPIFTDNPFCQEQASSFWNPASWNPGSRLVQYMSDLAQRQLKANEICVVMVTHGTNGEDGILQGFLELCGFSYIGPDTLGSAIGMDKHVAKVLVEKAGIPVAPYRAIRRHEWESGNRAEIIAVARSWGLPLFVKPANLGSSIGISKVTSHDGLVQAVETAFRYDEKILIEQGLDIREIECAALGGYAPQISRAGEINATAEFYSYEAKYVAKDGALIRVPAAIDQNQEDLIRDLSAKAFDALQLYGIARVDWFLEKATGKFYFNEVNTLPGFTSISQYPKLWEATGLSANALLSKMIQLAFDRRNFRSSLQRSNE